MKRIIGVASICTMVALVLAVAVGCGTQETNGVRVDEIPQDAGELADVVEDLPRGEVGGKVDQMFDHFRASGLTVGEINAMFIADGMTDAAWAEVEGERVDLYLKEDGELELYAPLHPELDRVQEAFDSF